MQVLTTDPSSHLAAAIAGWVHPVSREWLVLADLYDLTRKAAATRRTKDQRYPRPWEAPRRTRMGRATRPQREIRAALAARGAA